jgi:hypothetical protein
MSNKESQKNSPTNQANTIPRSNAANNTTTPENVVVPNVENCEVNDEMNLSIDYEVNPNNPNLNESI